MFALTCGRCIKHLMQDRSSVEKGVMYFELPGVWPFLCCSLAQGLIRGEIEAAAQRARGHGVLSRVCDAPGRGECAATGLEHAKLQRIQDGCLLCNVYYYICIYSISNSKHENCLRGLCFQRFVAFNVRL